jgi:glycosyltransferase involved in cell wall biosynthesis
VIFINRYFHPDLSATSEMLSDLAFALSELGMSVTIITSRLRYEDGKALYSPSEIIRGVQIHRVWTSQFGRFLLLGRSLDYLSFFSAAGWRLWRLARAGDVVVAKTDPPLLSVMAAAVAKLKSARLVNWLQDIFPEVAEALNFGGGPARAAFRLMRPLRNWSLRAADINVVVGEGMAERLRGLGIDGQNIRIIQNWSDGSLVLPIEPKTNGLRTRWIPKSHFAVGYAGNLGRAHDVATIIEAMTLLGRAAKSQEDDLARRIMFVFVGGGALRAKLEREVLKRGITNVRLHPYQPRERLAETLGSADVHLVSLNPRLEGLIAPSKFYGIAAAGRPTLFIGAANGEIARLIEEFECGFTINPGDGKGLADRILQLAQDPQLCAALGARARTAFEKHWDKRRAVEKWDEVLKAVATSRGPQTASGPSSDVLRGPGSRLRRN